MVILTEQIAVTKWLTLILRLKNFLFKFFLLAAVVQAREQTREIEELGLGISAEQDSTQNYTSASKNGSDSSRQEDLEKVGASVVAATSWQNQAKKDCFAISKKLVEWKPCSIDIKWPWGALVTLVCACHRFWKNRTAPAGSTTNQTALPATNTEPNVNGTVSAKAAGSPSVPIDNEDTRDEKIRRLERLERRVGRLEAYRGLTDRLQDDENGLSNDNKRGYKENKRKR